MKRKSWLGEEEDEKELRRGLAQSILPHVDFTKKPVQPKPQVNKPPRRTGKAGRTRRDK